MAEGSAKIAEILIEAYRRATEAAGIIKKTRSESMQMVEEIVDQTEMLIIAENLIDELRLSVPELTALAGFPDITFSNQDLRRIIGNSILAQDLYTPFLTRRNPLVVDQPIFDRSQETIIFDTFRRRFPSTDLGIEGSSSVPIRRSDLGGFVDFLGPVKVFRDPRLSRGGMGAPQTLEARGITPTIFGEDMIDDTLLREYDEAAAELKEAADRLTAGSEDIREAANALLGASPVTIRDDGADTDTVIEFRPPGPHAEVVTVPLATAEAKAFIDEMDEAMRPIREGIDALFADMRATVEDIFGEAEDDWRAFGDTATDALRDILAAHRDMMGKLAQLLSPLGSLVFGGGGVEGGAGSGDPGGPSSGAQAPIRRYAEGGIAPAGLPALVGEAGPELFVPDIFADFGQPTAGLREVELPVIFTRSIDARGAAPGVEQAINRVLDDFERTFREHDAHEINAGLRRNGFIGRLKFARPPCPTRPSLPPDRLPPPGGRRWR